MANKDTRGVLDVKLYSIAQSLFRINKISINGYDMESMSVLHVCDRFVFTTAIT